MQLLLFYNRYPKHSTIIFIDLHTNYLLIVKYFMIKKLILFIDNKRSRKIIIKSFNPYFTGSTTSTQKMLYALIHKLFKIFLTELKCIIFIEIYYIFAHFYTFLRYQHRPTPHYFQCLQAHHFKFVNNFITTILQ